MNSKRCFTPVHCTLSSQCMHAHQPFKNGSFQPTAIGDHCHQFSQIKFSDPTYDELTEKIAALVGAHA